MRLSPAAESGACPTETSNQNSPQPASPLLHRQPRRPSSAPVLLQATRKMRRDQLQILVLGRQKIGSRTKKSRPSPHNIQLRTHIKQKHLAGPVQDLCLDGWPL